MVQLPQTVLLAMKMKGLKAPNLFSSPETLIHFIMVQIIYTEAYNICNQNELHLEGLEPAQYHCAKCEIITVYCETAENFIKLNQK